MAQRYAVAKEVTGKDGVGIAPAFCALTDEQVAPWLRIASKCIGLTRWVDCASDGHALLTAHFLEAHVGIDGEGGSMTGPLTAEAHGPASRSFASSTPTDAELSTTSFGRAFLILRRKVRGRGTAIVMNSCARQIE